MASQKPFFVVCYRGVYSELLYNRGKKARVIAKAKAAYIVNRGAKAE